MTTKYCYSPAEYYRTRQYIKLRVAARSRGKKNAMRPAIQFKKPVNKNIKFDEQQFDPHLNTNIVTRRTANDTTYFSR